MLRKMFLLFVGMAALTLVANVSAEDKKKEEPKKTTTVSGKLVCGKCKLSETEECSNVVVVKDGEKEVKYYLNDKGKKEKYHKCSGEKDVKVTGVVAEKEGKKTISSAKVEDKK